MEQVETSAPTPAGEATRQRILATARTAFADRGFAGTPISQIASEARASRERLYVYYRSKEDLFCAVLAEALHRWFTEVPFDVDDLPGHAVGLHRFFIAHHPEARLLLWGQLSGHSGHAVWPDDQALIAHRVAVITEAQHDGRVSASIPPRRLLTMILGAALAPFLDPEATTPNRLDDAEAQAREQMIHATITAAVDSRSSTPAPR